MKPSEFWARIFALPEQARQAEQDASKLRADADALCEWARLATSIHRDAIFSADSGEMTMAEDALARLIPRPDDPTTAVVNAPSELAMKSRKPRSDAGKRRARKTEGTSEVMFDESATANPANVKAADAARAKLAGELRALFKESSEPVTIPWMITNLPVIQAPDSIRNALELLSLVSWRMQRDGDSQPVEVWGTEAQFRDYVQRAWPGLDDEHIAKELGVVAWLVTRARKAAP